MIAPRTAFKPAGPARAQGRPNNKTNRENRVRSPYAAAEQARPGRQKHWVIEYRWRGQRWHTVITAASYRAARAQFRKDNPHVEVYR